MKLLNSFYVPIPIYKLELRFLENEDALDLFGLEVFFTEKTGLCSEDEYIMLLLRFQSFT